MEATDAYTRALAHLRLEEWIIYESLIWDSAVKTLISLEWTMKAYLRHPQRQDHIRRESPEHYRKLHTPTIHDLITLLKCYKKPPLAEKTAELFYNYFDQLRNPTLHASASLPPISLLEQAIRDVGATIIEYLQVDPQQLKAVRKTGDFQAGITVGQASLNVISDRILTQPKKSLTPKRSLMVVISHSDADVESAQSYEDLLDRAGFSVVRRSHRDGVEVPDFGAPRQIERCHHFLFFNSRSSAGSFGVQRDLGLAIKWRDARKDYRPAIVSLGAVGAKVDKVPDLEYFPTRDPDTGEERSPLDLNEFPHVAEPGEALVTALRPHLLVSRKDFHDSETFEETGVLDLYQELFPPREQDKRADIVRWVLRGDLGQRREVRLPSGLVLDYTLDSRYFILTIAGKAVGLAFFTYDHSSCLMYGNYIAIGPSWRSGDLAGDFVDKIFEVFRELFPEYKGIIFEVEKFDENKLDEVLSYLRVGGQDKRIAERRFATAEDTNEFKRALRIVWYEDLGCDFFLDAETGRPLTCHSPCLDPREKDWAAEEADYWIMFYERKDRAPIIGSHEELWKDAVRCIYLEILGKSLVAGRRMRQDEYWKYCCRIVDETLSCTGSVRLDKYLETENQELKRNIMSQRYGMSI